MPTLWLEGHSRPLVAVRLVAHLLPPPFDRLPAMNARAAGRALRREHRQEARELVRVLSALDDRELAGWVDALMAHHFGGGPHPLDVPPSPRDPVGSIRSTPSTPPEWYLAFVLSGDVA